jgi:hypothetical protein
MKITNLAVEFPHQITGVLDTPYLGTLIEVLWIAFVFAVGLTMLFGLELAENFKSLDEGDWFSLWFGLGIWIITYFVALAFHYNLLYELLTKSVSTHRLLHLLYWIVRWLILILTVASNNATLIVLGFYADIIFFPGIAILAVLYVLTADCIKKIRKDYARLNSTQIAIKV